MIQERKTYRTFHLERAVAGEKHRRRVGVDALDGCTAMGRGIGKPREDRLWEQLSFIGSACRRSRRGITCVAAAEEFSLAAIGAACYARRDQCDPMTAPEPRPRS